MNLGKKKALAVRTLGVGKSRIVFLESRLDEIKEAITKQDIKDLKMSGAIIIKDVKGRMKKEKKNKRSVGNVRKKVNKRKQEYVKSTRKLRRLLVSSRDKEKLSMKEIEDIRKKIKNKIFKSESHMKEFIRSLRTGFSFTKRKATV